MRAAKRGLLFIAIVFTTNFLNVSGAFSQVSLPERNPLKLTIRAGAIKCRFCGEFLDGLSRETILQALETEDGDTVVQYDR